MLTVKKFKKISTSFSFPNIQKVIYITFAHENLSLVKFLQPIAKDRT